MAVRYTTGARRELEAQGCSVTVYDAGTSSLSTIYCNPQGDAKANPFTWAGGEEGPTFYAAVGEYDVTVEGTALPTLQRYEVEEAANREFFGLGTAAAPSITFEGDSDCGFYRSSANVIGVAGGLTGVSSLTGTGVISLTKTVTSATPSTERLVRSEYTITPATTTTLGTGSLVGVRGAVTLSSGKSLTGGFLYGTQGKLILNGTVNIGSGMAYGVMGQLDVTGGTITAGYVAGVGSDIFGVSSGTVAVDLFYGQHADGGTINSYFRAYGKSTYAFEFDTNSGTAVTTVAAGSAANKWVRLRVDGTAYKIALLADS